MSATATITEFTSLEDLTRAVLAESAPQVGVVVDEALRAGIAEALTVALQNSPRRLIDLPAEPELPSTAKRTPEDWRDQLIAELRTAQAAAQERSAAAKQQGLAADPFDRDVAGWLAAGLCDLFADKTTGEFFRVGIFNRLVSDPSARFVEADFLRPDGIKFLEAGRPAQSMLTKLSLASTTQFRAAAVRLMNQIVDKLAVPAPQATVVVSSNEEELRQIVGNDAVFLRYVEAPVALPEVPTEVQFPPADAELPPAEVEPPLPEVEPPLAEVPALPAYPEAFESGEDYAERLDAADPIRAFREQFLIPKRPDGTPKIYLCGHSLGLQPVGVRALIEQELDDWARLGVEGHFHGKTPWYSYHEKLRDSGARLVGALPHEVVFMNSLTVNLHLMMATFYRPDSARNGILIDDPAFPSDLYAHQSQLLHHGFNPAECLRSVGPRARENGVRIEEVEQALIEHGSRTAVVIWNPVNFLTGQFFDVPRLVEAAHRQGCIVGLDLAHAIGNVPLQLHDWNVDFAVWCSYKYLNGGPGAVGGCFVHEKHGHDTSLPRLAGWWGNDPATRFRMHLQPEFIPKEGADGWQISNPPIFSMAPLRASLEQFDRAGMAALRQKSERLTGYLLYLLDQLPPGRFEVVTQRDPAQRGSQISLLVNDRPRDLVKALEAAGVVCDFREPNIIRAAPVPLYNTFQDVWTFARILGSF